MFMNTYRTGFYVCAHLLKNEHVCGRLLIFGNEQKRTIMNTNENKRAQTSVLE
ncbi:hypothetical protein Hanom_Chr15g01350841 [Helianthus anomalus]